MTSRWPRLLFVLVALGFCAYGVVTQWDAFADALSRLSLPLLAGALLASRRGRVRLRMLVGTAIAFGLLEAVTAFAPNYWLFAALLTVVGLLGLTFNTTGNSMVQLETDPSMRGRVMSLYMMVFTGGTPIGGPIVGWITEQFGPRIGLFACGAVSATSAALVGLILARTAGLRPRLSRAGVSFVPREVRRKPRRAAEPDSPDQVTEPRAASHCDKVCADRSARASGSRLSGPGTAPK